ncbi:hypothetical protein DPMN_185853 [Dreissena polymorpha]|uniref:Bicarbonate transporter-like transmembrane domain-containing protein n=1 Tax=Dreissena polymorpha TaxID=45954 RepID=A0A9D4I7N3_DREPO|nr:hypothetical protein DPMN_185853 [Dreissena polymorpha]
MHVFTGIQLVLVGILWAVKSTVVAIAFPLFVFLMVPLRLLLMPKYFTHEELEAVSRDIVLPIWDFVACQLGTLGLQSGYFVACQLGTVSAKWSLCAGQVGTLCLPSGHFVFAKWEICACQVGTFLVYAGT